MPPGDDTAPGDPERRTPVEPPPDESTTAGEAATIGGRLGEHLDDVDEYGGRTPPAEVTAVGGGPGAETGGTGTGGGICNLSLPLLFVVRLSTLLVLASWLLPDAGTRTPVRALVRGYQRTLSRSTPACPQPTSCSEFTRTAVARHGTRRGLRAAADRIADCGTHRS